MYLARGLEMADLQPKNIFSEDKSLEDLMGLGDGKFLPNIPESPIITRMSLCFRHPPRRNHWPHRLKVI